MTTEFRPPTSTSPLRVVLAVVVAVVVLGPAVVLACVAFGMSPTTYRIADGAVTVHSGEAFGDDRRIPLGALSEVRVVDLAGGRRTHGTALPGFCAGSFWYDNLGPVWQATDCRRRVLLLRSSAGVVLISPPDPEAFAARILAGEPASVTLPPPDRSPLSVLGLVVVPLAVLLTATLVALLLAGPGRMRYRVADGALEVRTLFGRARWPLAGATARVHRPERLWRVAGTGLPGYYTGRFRESGLGTRVYATRVDRGVLVEGAARVFVTPDDPGAFLAALRREGARVEG